MRNAESATRASSTTNQPYTSLHLSAFQVHTCSKKSHEHRANPYTYNDHPSHSLLGFQIEVLPLRSPSLNHLSRAVTPFTVPTKSLAFISFALVRSSGSQSGSRSIVGRGFFRGRPRFLDGVRPFPIPAAFPVPSRLLTSEVKLLITASLALPLASLEFSPLAALNLDPRILLPLR
jgi:hypothetical protein